MTDSQAYVLQLGQRARAAARVLATLDGNTKVAILRTMAGALRARTADLLAANAKDIDAAKAAGLAPALIKRLELNEKKVAAMAEGVEQIAAQVDPVGQVIEGFNRPNGLRIQKVRSPLGVVLFFYESRPNVTSDAAALCIKSGNAVILRGGKEAFHSNKVIVEVIQEALRGPHSQLATRNSQLPELADAVQFVESTDRALVPQILKLDKYIDLVIPRGGESLIRAVVADSTIPVLKHFTGNCHIYVDKATDGMEDLVTRVCVNAKTSYPGGAVCNAVEHLLFHRDAAPRLVGPVCKALAAAGVEVRADDAARKFYPGAIPTTDKDWDEEYLAFIVGVKVVGSIDEAVAHINEHGSHHTDAILTSDVRAANQFVRDVDSASVMVNASTRFADGGEYGLGAEIGISTDKLHARGPMGASDLCTYKWVVTGEGHCR
ncbi:MAG TPA: glutamate-5-semialdehyde dehydrogenase [Tepidisphaeraceae bacterium]|nr:glutamate-5-semialdehyde dehydrogenase [Tepidisphaeraceae bacterium]